MRGLLISFVQPHGTRMHPKRETPLCLTSRNFKEVKTT